MTQSISEIAEIINNPKGGDKIYLTRDNVDLVVPSLYPWYRSGRGYAEGQLKWVKGMMENPIRYANLRAGWDDYCAGGSDEPRGWIIGWNWAVKGLTETQMRVLRDLPQFVEAYESGNGVAIMPGAEPTHLVTQIKFRSGIHNYCETDGVAMKASAVDWGHVTCGQCIEKGTRMGYIIL